MPVAKHSALAGIPDNPAPGKNLFGGRGVWTIIVAVTLAFTLLTAITSCQERADAQQAEAERQQLANNTTAVQECERRFLISPPDNYELGHSESEESSSSELDRKSTRLNSSHWE